MFIPSHLPIPGASKSISSLKLQYLQEDKNLKQSKNVKKKTNHSP